MADSKCVCLHIWMLNIYHFWHNLAGVITTLKLRVNFSTFRNAFLVPYTMKVP